MLAFDDLTRMFKTHPGETSVLIRGKCITCKRDLTLEVSKTTGGFGINGGVLLGQDSKNYVVTCLDCSDKPSSPESKGL